MNDSVPKMLGLVLRNLGTGVLVFVVLNIDRAHSSDLAVRGAAGVFCVLAGVIIERTRRW